EGDAGDLNRALADRVAGDEEQGNVDDVPVPSHRLAPPAILGEDAVSVPRDGDLVGVEDVQGGGAVLRVAGDDAPVGVTAAGQRVDRLMHEFVIRLERARRPEKGRGGAGDEAGAFVDFVEAQ